MCKFDLVNQIVAIAFQDSIGLDQLDLWNLLDVDGVDVLIIVKNLTNPLKRTDLQDGGFCFLGKGVINNGDRSREAADAGRNRDGAIAIVGDAIAEGDVARSVEVIDFIGSVDCCTDGITGDGEGNVGGLGGFLTQRYGVDQILTITLGDGAGFNALWLSLSVVVKDLAGALKGSNGEHGAFRVFREGVIDDWNLGGEAGDACRNGDGAIAIVRDTTAECDVGRSCEIVHLIGRVDRGTNRIAADGKREIGGFGCLAVQNNRVGELSSVSFLNGIRIDRDYG